MFVGESFNTIQVVTLHKRHLRANVACIASQALPKLDFAQELLNPKTIDVRLSAGVEFLEHALRHNATPTQRMALIDPLPKQSVPFVPYTR